MSGTVGLHGPYRVRHIEIVIERGADELRKAPLGLVGKQFKAFALLVCDE